MKVLAALNWENSGISSLIFPYKRSINKSQINVIDRSQCSRSTKVDYTVECRLSIPPSSCNLPSIALEEKKSRRSLLIKSRYNQIAKSMKVRGLSRRKFFFFSFPFLSCYNISHLFSRFLRHHRAPLPLCSVTSASLTSTLSPSLWSRDRSYGKIFQTVNCESSNTTSTVSRL